VYVFSSEYCVCTDRLVFMGDDTWATLFPTQFDIAYPFDSFNTRVRLYKTTLSDCWNAVAERS
jgi:hypothetical protein